MESYGRLCLRLWKDSINKNHELYNKIEEHFIQKPNERCYVCLCEKGYRHSIPLGFPRISEKT